MNVKKKRLLRQIDADDDKLIEFEIYKKKFQAIEISNVDLH